MREDNAAVGQNERAREVFSGAFRSPPLFRFLEEFPVDGGIRVTVHIEAADDVAVPHEASRPDVQDHLGCSSFSAGRRT